MIILNATTKSLEIVLGGSVSSSQLPFSASYVDMDDTTWALTGMSESDGASNGTTAVTIVAAPAANSRRQVKAISIYNADNANVTLTIRVNNNGTTRIIFKAVLATLEFLYFGDAGWQVFTANGELKIANTV